MFSFFWASPPESLCCSMTVHWTICSPSITAGLQAWLADCSTATSSQEVWQPGCYPNLWNSEYLAPPPGPFFRGIKVHACWGKLDLHRSPLSSCCLLHLIFSTSHRLSPVCYSWSTWVSVWGQSCDLSDHILLHWPWQEVSLCVLVTYWRSRKADIWLVCHEVAAGVLIGLQLPFPWWHPCEDQDDARG